MTKGINTISMIKSLFSFYFHIHGCLTLGVADFVSSLQNIKCVININVPSFLIQSFTRDIIIGIQYTLWAKRIGWTKCPSCSLGNGILGNIC